MLGARAGDRQARARADARRAGEEHRHAAQELIRQVTHDVNGFSDAAKTQFFNVLDKVPMAYQKTNAIFATPEKKKPGGGGIFSIFVSDLCKGCAACVTACGEHDALRMVQETEEVNAEHESGTAFLDLLPDTPQKYLGLYNDSRPQDSKTATLRNMLMVRRNYDALVSGDGACAGCGEKSILRACAAVTEAYMRPLYHAKADRLRAKADQLDKDGVQNLAALKARSQDEYDLLRQAVAHMLMGLGGEDDKDTKGRMAAHGPISDRDVDRRDHRGDAAGGVQPQEPPADRRPARQRHVGDGDGGAHRLQHRLRLDAAQQPASLSVDELALPGRHHRRLAPRRELHRRPRPPVGDPRAACRCADAPPKRSSSTRAQLLRATCTSPTR